VLLLAQLHVPNHDLAKDDDKRLTLCAPSSLDFAKGMFALFFAATLATAVVDELVFEGLTNVGAPTPPRPAPSEAFQANVNVAFHEGRRQFHGKGVYIVDQKIGKAVEDYDFKGTREPFYSLQRYDLGFVYDYDGTQCTASTVSGSMPPVWGWISQAKYGGQHKLGNKVIDLWRADLGQHVRVALGVLSTSANTPVFVDSEHRGGKEHIEFTSWSTTNLNTTAFNVPSFCP